MRSLHTKGIVLRRTNYSEYDRIIQVITPDYGKVSLIAKGVRKEKSKLAGSIELFARSDFTFTEGKGDLRILTGARLEKFYGGIIGDYDRLQFGYEAVKQVAKAADNLDEPAFFDLLEQVLGFLDAYTVSLKLVMTWFWLQLAILLGEGANLATDDEGMKLLEDKRYDFDVEQSVFRVSQNGRYTSQHIKLLRLLSAKEPTFAMKIQGINELIDSCLWLAEHAIAH